MKNRIYLFTVAVASFMCISCTKTQTTLSENEKAVNPPIMGWSSWNAFRVDISEDIMGQSENPVDMLNSHCQFA